MSTFSWEKIKKPILALAPMAGYTDSAYRQVVKSLVPEVICFSELTSTNAMKHDNEKTMQMLNFEKSESPLIMQLFGNKPEFFIEAGKRLEQLGIAGIDINMGCPARKVIHSQQGSALLKDPDLAAEIVNKLSKAVKIPVSVKTRIGYNCYDEEELPKFLKSLETAGAKLITLHGRTTKQSFLGKADWEPIYKIKKILNIPLIGNGDITTAEIAVERLKNLDGIMVGRATFGNPWLMAEISAKLTKQKHNSPQSIKDRLPIIKEHFRLSLKTKGEKYGILEMRKHLGSYIKGIEGASAIRQRIMQSEDSQEILSILEEIA
ncbi:tRNA dihydrouridine synthase DusB [Patescibacteria group bacterium]|nr:tRNA dihydrouridine synthase DusB [Patescibacteria group bacterium]